MKYIKELAVSQWRGADVVDARGDGQQWKTGAGQIHKGPEAKKKKSLKSSECFRRGSYFVPNTCIPSAPVHGLELH